MKAVLRNKMISPKKANLVAQLVRTMKASEAADILKYTNKKAAPIIRKLVESAMANAESNFKQDPNNLYIKEIVVTEGPTYKRALPISKGRTHPILKRTSHITVKLQAGEIAPSKRREKKVKAEEKIEKAKTTKK